MAEAVGILEVFGLTTAFVAADAGCKAANVHLEVFDKNKPANADSLPVPLLVCIADSADSLCNDQSGCITALFIQCLS